jgi:hypothetical protein
MMLDLPQPFGPTTFNLPGQLVGVVGSAKDLKPESLMVWRRTGTGWRKTPDYPAWDAALQQAAPARQSGKARMRQFPKLELSTQ